MQANGTLENGTDLVLRRLLAQSPSEVWHAIADSDGLGRWFGTYTGDPASGVVQVSMNAEPGADDAEPTEYEIIECVPAAFLMVRSTTEVGTWTLSLRLVELAEGTQISLRHHDIDVEVIGEVGAGWEWYLDRLVAAITGAVAPGLEDFEPTYFPAADHYRSLVPKD
ncbi:MAG: hypothetical protein GX868_00320 [Actinobacteria bacterium]|nr:hypothetical protein [Actinomycetota bacterium]